MIIFMLDERLRFIACEGSSLSFLPQSARALGSPLGSLLPSERGIEICVAALDGSSGEFDSAVAGRRFKVVVEPVASPHGVSRLRGVALPAPEGPTGEFGLLSIGTVDMAQRKAAEAKISLQARLLDEVPCSVIAIGTDRRVKSWNKGAEALFGVSASEALGRKAAELAVFPEDRAKADEIIQTLAKGETWTGEWWFPHKNGSRVPVYVTDSPIFDSDGEVTGYVGVAMDITALKAAENDLQSLLEQIPVGVLFRNTEGVYTRVNAAALALANLEPHQVLGKKGADLLRHARVVANGKQVTPEDTRVKSGLATEQADIFVTGPDGQEREVRTTVSPVMLGDEIQGHVVVLVDMTEQNRLERHLRHTQKMEAVGRLAGGVAHDYNNLLSVILNYARFVHQDVTDPAVRADVEEIIKAGESASSLTRQLLTFSRREPVKPELVDLNTTIEGLGKMIRRLVPESVEVDIQLTPSLPEVVIDAPHVEQVVMNLVLNAGDSMALGGTLTVRTAEVLVEAGGKANIAGGRYVRLDVGDTGSGMTPDVISRVFEPFFTTKPAGEGGGLGLATAYGIVAQAGGAIEITSELDVGSTFSVFLPVAHDPSLGTEQPVTRGVVMGRKILVVEDEPAVRELVDRILTQAGHDVLSAATGAEALRLSASWPVDLVVSDVVMPGMDGVTLSRRIDAPTLFMSGYPDRTVSGFGLEIGSERLISKPFTEQALLTKVAETILAEGRA